MLMMLMMVMIMNDVPDHDGNTTKTHHGFKTTNIFTSFEIERDIVSPDENKVARFRDCLLPSQAGSRRRTE